jgi:hypothetical protein
MEKISWIDCVRNEVILHGVKGDIQYKDGRLIGLVISCVGIVFRKAIGMVRSEGQGRRRKQPLDGLKETRGQWKLKEEALDRPVWRTGFRRGRGSVVRETME